MELTKTLESSSTEVFEKVTVGNDMMRKFVRHPSNIPVNISLDSVDSEHVSNLQNLSHGGLCCDVAQSIDIAIACSGRTLSCLTL